MRPCHHGMTHHLCVGGRDGVHVRRVFAIILNNQMRTGDKEWSYSWSLGSGVPRWVWGVRTPPRNSEGPPKLFQTEPDLRKLLKIAEFRTQTPQDVRKKRQ